MDNSKIRINKYLSEAGVCSRRQADNHIIAGDVMINGKVAVIGDTVDPSDIVLFCGDQLKKEEQMILFAVNKPVGIVCTAQKKEKNNIVDYLNFPKRIYPIGRLDKDSEGLILMTNNGDIVNKIMRAGNLHEKEYIVKVNKALTESFLKGMAGGVPLTELNLTTRKCKLEKLGRYEFRIVLTQGLNRQIRRMCEHFGYRVEQLKRIRIMNIDLGDLKAGEYRELSKEELKELHKLLKDSSNQPYSNRIQENAFEKSRSEKNGYRKKNQRVKRTNRLS